MSPLHVVMIGVPQAVDQFGNADRLVELGVARRLDVDATPTRCAPPSPPSRRRGRGHRHPATAVTQTQAEPASAPVVPRSERLLPPRPYQEEDSPG